MGADERESARWDVAILYALAVAGYPLIAGLPLMFGIESRAISVPFRAIVLALSLWALFRSVAKSELYRGPLWAPLIVFWTLYIARILWDTLLNPVPLGQPRSEYFIYGVGTCLIPLLALLSTPSDATLRLALRLTFTACAAAAVFTLGTGMRALLGGNFTVVSSGRFELATFNPISFGHLGVSLVTLALFRLQTEGFARRAAAVGFVVAAAIGLVCAGISASKGPLIALIVSFVLLLMVDWNRGRRGRALAKGAVATTLSIPALFVLEQRFGFTIVSRFRAAVDPEERGSVTERVELFRRARDQFFSHPLTGGSLEDREWLSYPHNTFLESFMATGIIGGTAYVVFHLGALWFAVRLAISTPSAAWLAILCLQYSVAALFSGSLYFSNTMWGLLAAVVAAQSRRAVHARSFVAIPARA